MCFFELFICKVSDFLLIFAKNKLYFSTFYRKPCSFKNTNFCLFLESYLAVYTLSNEKLKISKIFKKINIKNHLFLFFLLTLLLNKSTCPLKKIQQNEN